MKTFFLLFAVFLFFSKNSYSQPGELDSSFGKNGITKSDLGTIYDYVSTPKQVLEAPDGTLYTIREQDGQTFISKRDKNGVLVLDYGSNGISRAANLREERALLQPDGKIVITGYTSLNNRKDFIIVRFTTDGGLDNSFSGDGIQRTTFTTAAYATSIALQNDGKIVVAGYVNTIDNEGESNSDFALARYNIDGTLDNSFSEDGTLVTKGNASDNIPTAIAIQDDGKIVVAGSSNNNSQGDHSSFSTIIRYDEDGSIDSSFSNDNEKFGFLFASPNALTIQSDGKIVIAGQSIESTEDDNGVTTDIFIARYNANGSLDKTFNNKGWETSDFGYDKENAFAIAIHDNGKILVGCNIWNGNNTDFALARYNAEGGLDSSFSDNGLKRIDFDYGEETATLLSVHSNGKIVMAGSSNFSNLGIAHLNKDGTLDDTFNGNGKLVVVPAANKQGSTNYACIAVQNDGKIVVGGNTWNGNNTDFVVARYQVNGTLDSTFNKHGWQTSDLSDYVDGVNSIAIQPDGKIVAGGQTSGQSGTRFALVRYNTDGTPDSTFANNGVQKSDLNSVGQINAITLQADGKIVAVGNSWNGSNNDIAIARYKIDGSLDSTFGINGRLQTDIGNSEDIGNSVVIQSDGKILVAGSIYNYSNTDFVIVRYSANGILDASFNNNGILSANMGGNDDCTGIALQDDGKIVVTGSSSSAEDYDNLNTNIVTARYNTDGTPDNTFNIDGKVITDLGNNDNASSIAIEKNGKIVVAGGSNSRFAFVRYTTDGYLDSTFSQNGISTVSSKGSNAIENTVTGIAILNNKLYAAGNGKYPGNLGVVVKYQLDAGTRKPIVSITTPVNDTVYAAPATIHIHAEATDLDGKVSKVEFYNGDSLLITQTVAPYDYTWIQVPPGNYTLTVKATDDNGNTTTSDKVKVSVIAHKAPTVSIINPANYEIFAGPLTLRLRAVAIDPEGTITKVEFYKDSILLHTETVYPYSYNWKNIAPGDYSITAKATNNSGLSKTSAVVHFSVVPNRPPSVFITSIADGQSFPAPATIPLTAVAKDPDGTIRKVEFYEGAVLISTNYSSPYTIDWKKVPAGTYTITAKAIDNFGLSTISDPVTVTVADTMKVSNRKLAVNNKAVEKDIVSLKAWPNPVDKTLIIYTQGLPKDKPTTITILTGSGIAIKTMRVANASQSAQLDVSTLVPGMYIIKVTCADKIISQQFIKL